MARTFTGASPDWRPATAEKVAQQADGWPAIRISHHADMWIKRTSEEVTKWQKAAENEARSHGRLMAGFVWILVSIGAAGGSFFIIGGTALVFQRDISGSFWLRLPVFGLITAPIAYWIFRHERRREFAKIVQRTICPVCDTAAEGNAGAACLCGGSFVLSSTMKWIGK